MNVKIKILKNGVGIVPKYATPGSSGADLSAAVEDDLVIDSNKIALVPCGFSIQIPHGYEGQIRSRSGLSLNHGIVVLNSPGTIDSDYRGEVKIILMNLSNEKFTVKRGMRLAQLVITTVQRVSFVETDVLDCSNRSEQGFGSTGF